MYYKLEKHESLVAQIMDALYQLKIQSVIVEGGAKLLQSFIDEGVWDEARIIKNQSLTVGNGLAGPVLPEKLVQEESTTDRHTPYFL